MRDVAGQINGENFTGLSAGVAGGAAAAFTAAYTKQVQTAVPPAGFFEAGFPAFESAQIDLLATGGVRTKKGVRGGEEHVGITLGTGAGDLGALADPIALPPGAAFGFAYSFASFFDSITRAWNLLQTGDSQGRVTPDLVPDPNGAITLQSLDFYGSNDGTQLMSVLKGQIAVNDADLPPVSFTLTTTETGQVAASAGDIQFVSFQVDTQLDKDTSAFDERVSLIEALGALLQGPIGYSGVYGAYFAIQSYVQSLLQGLTVNPVRFLPFVGALYPIRVLLPGTSERMIFRYSGFSVPTGGPRTNGAPKGFGALARLDVGNATLFLKNGAFTAFGEDRPFRAARVPFIGIVGPAKVQFPQNPSRKGEVVTATYNAITNDEVEPPIDFEWTVTVVKKTKSTSVTPMTSSGPTITVQFYDAGVTPTPPEIDVRLAVSMDDALHLRDSSKRKPTAVRKIDVKSATTGTGMGGGGGGATGKGQGKAKSRTG